MWLRLLGACVLALVLQTAVQPDTANTLRQKYGAPISESYLVRPGVVASASYGPSGQVCEIVISPQRLWNGTFDSKSLTDIIDEVVPINERGKYLMGTFVNATCIPTEDCYGSEGTWENVSIFRNGGTDKEHYAQIRWLRDECRPRGAN